MRSQVFIDYPNMMEEIILRMECNPNSRCWIDCDPELQWVNGCYPSFRGRMDCNPSSRAWMGAIQASGGEWIAIQAPGREWVLSKLQGRMDCNPRSRGWMQRDPSSRSSYRRQQVGKMCDSCFHLGFCPIYRFPVRYSSGRYAIKVYKKSRKLKRKNYTVANLRTGRTWNHFNKSFSFLGILEMRMQNVPRTETEANFLRRRFGFRFSHKKRTLFLSWRTRQH